MEKAEKISVSDLSIGDWVCVQFPDGDKWSGRIVSSSNTGRMRVLCSNTKVVGCTIHFICPIPITAEVMEKNGWSEFSDYHNSWKLDIDSDKRVWMFKNSHDWTFQVMSWGLGHNHSVAKAYIKDIHELQHALRLAKVGKEIVL